MSSKYVDDLVIGFWNIDGVFAIKDEQPENLLETV
jgi:hypothetical protein